MSTNKAKLIDQKHEQADQTRQHNWEVMKPFIRFSYLALKVIGFALISIVKTLPRLKPSVNKTTEVKDEGLTQQ